MCICINCRHIHNCVTYQFISKQHNYVSKEPQSYFTFFPKDTIINVNLGKKKMSSILIGI